ncbi:BatA domain-containing protein [Spirosoma sp. RP8]|uniref:BatA domain-containing protein n=1 Tax=Spirosoma liriopis TaxID=2937440 RepID=A0ABT0HQC7_9BACT|nr:BatA domain-containing protein [Spirosoma liriopis]MCK8493853.1 BatA domain-containing protein [Spirosoma liriopis]
MAFLEPFLLWGALAVLSPIIIHFWHQKKGKPLAWAATQWLVEKNQQQQRGLKLENIVLLILRCLLLLVLVALLSQLVLNNLKSKADNQPIHLIQPNALLSSNYRFELEEARKRGEKLYWMDENTEPVDGLTELPAKPNFSPLLLQAAIDKRRHDEAEVHLYLLNTDGLATVPAVYVPARFRLHTITDSSQKPRAYLATKGGQKLFVNQAGRLTTSAVLDPTLKFQSAPAHTGPLRVLVQYSNQREQRTVEAALNALAEVYDLDLSIDHTPTRATPYDWVLTDRINQNPTPQTLYIVSGKSAASAAPNVRFHAYAFTPQTDERVASGQLPEWLGERLIEHYGLRVSSEPLSQQELKSLFVVASRSDRKPQTLVHNVLVLLFVVLLIAERWIALTKNA